MRGEGKSKLFCVPVIEKSLAQPGFEGQVVLAVLEQARRAIEANGGPIYHAEVGSPGGLVILSLGTHQNWLSCQSSPKASLNSATLSIDLSFAPFKWSVSDSKARPAT